MRPPRAVIFGCAGRALSADEGAFFREADPLGFILFARNIETPEQARRGWSTICGPAWHAPRRRC